MPPRISWQESKDWENHTPRFEFNNVPASRSSHQRPMLNNLVPVWKQHSFECWQAPSRAPPKQHSLDSTINSRRHTSQQFFHSKGKSCINFTNADQKRRSTPQHYRKLHSKNSLSFGLDQIKHASSYTLENNSSYPPEAVGTPLASRRQWFVKSTRKADGTNIRKAESNASSPQSPLIPLENLQSFKRSKNNVHISMNKFTDHNPPSYKQHALDLPLHSYNTHNVRKDDRYVPELIIPFSQSSQPKPKISPDFKMEAYKREKVLSRQKYYNSCRHIYQNEHAGLLCTTPDFNIPCCYQAENYLSPLQQYLMEQAKLSGIFLSIFLCSLENFLSFVLNLLVHLFFLNVYIYAV